MILKLNLLVFLKIESTEKKEITQQKKKKESDEKRELLGQIKDLLEKTASQLNDDLPDKKSVGGGPHLPWEKKSIFYLF